MAIQEKYYRDAFLVSLGLKAIGAASQLLFGIALLFSSDVSRIVVYLVRNELLEDPTDYIATHMSHYFPLSPHTQLMAALYLLVHGAIKAFLIWGLVKNKLWAYPASLIFIALIVFYQIISLASAHPLLFWTLTGFDIIVAFLIWHEYRFMASRSRTQ